MEIASSRTLREASEAFVRAQREGRKLEMENARRVMKRLQSLLKLSAQRSSERRSSAFLNVSVKS